MTKDFVDITIEKLDADHSAEVLTEMKRLQSQYEPTDENRDQYDQLVSDYVERLTEATR